MASRQREISVSEFFLKNCHLLGFDTPSKALVTAVKEAVDNALDACEEAGVLPDIIVQVRDRFGKSRVVVEDNGPGFVESQIARSFGNDPVVNWATSIDMDKSSKTYGRPRVVDKYSTDHNGEETTTQGICPATIGAKNANPAAYSPLTNLFYVPVTHICMDYEPFHINYTAGQPYTGADTSVYPPSGETEMGGVIAWDAKVGKIVWSNREPFAVASGLLTTAGGVVFYGTLEGYLHRPDGRGGRYRCWKKRSSN